VKLWNTRSEIEINPFMPIIVKLGRFNKYNESYCIDASDGDLVLTEENNTLTKSLLEWFQSASSADLEKIF